MRVGLISDTHGYLPEPPPNIDCIIHAGDVAQDYNPMNWWINRFAPWASEVKKPIYMTFGNHDTIMEYSASREEIKSCLPSNVKMIVDDYEMIGGKKVWFSPWSPRYDSWGWMADEEELANWYTKIPDDTQVIISHSPPYGVADQLIDSALKYGLDRGHNVGSKALRSRIHELKQLESVVCGHIHEARGSYKLGNIDVFNVCAVDVEYQLRDDLYVIVEW